ncbi:beta-N-acetylglucosaminidase [Staphylococcus auricularis]
MDKKQKKQFSIGIVILLVVIFAVLLIINETSLFNGREKHPFNEAYEQQIGTDVINTKEEDDAFVKASDDEVKAAMKIDHEHHNLHYMDISQKVSISEDEANALLKDKGILSGKGKTFLKAQDKYKVNVIYLISHALVETGNGHSNLADGINDGTQTYYNFFGIGAFDEDALQHGTSYAKEQDWTTPEKAIMGGAKFVCHQYFDNNQRILYEMRWNPEHPGTNQYASDIDWDHHIASFMDTFYQDLGIKKDDIEKDLYR